MRDLTRPRQDDRVAPTTTREGSTSSRWIVVGLVAAFAFVFGIGGRAVATAPGV
jgi:hypothetical protein